MATDNEEIEVRDRDNQTAGEQSIEDEQSYTSDTEEREAKARAWARLQQKRNDKLNSKLYDLERLYLDSLSKCTNKSCSNWETKDNKFKTCGGCGCFKYCSKRCLDEDWQESHKYSCVRGSILEEID